MGSDLHTGQRTFYVGLSGLGDGVITEVPFRDSAGNDIKCNYISMSVAVDGGAGDLGGLVAELSGVSHKGDMITDTVSALNSTLEGSGICGFGVVATRNGLAAPFEWHGSNGEVATGVKLQTTTTGTSIFVGITYGNLYPLNSLRLEQSYDAGE